MNIVAKPFEIARRRIERGWDKSSLAKEAKINHSLVSRAEQGNGVSPTTAKAIADALQAPVFELFELAERVG